MKLREYLVQTANRFPSSRADNPRLEVEVLMRHVLGIQRSEYFASLEQDLTPKQQHEINLLAQRRLQGEPLAYITGHREFYGLDLVVNPNVLIPRQETELLVDRVRELAKANPDSELRIADVGTGSGAIAIAIACNVPHAKIYAVDIDLGALKVADINRRKHEASGQVELLQGDLLEPIKGQVDIIVSNPPYIKTADIADLSDEVRQEPIHALDGGVDGLDVIRHLLQQALSRLKSGGHILFELSPEQLEPATELASNLLPHSEISYYRDLLGLPRVLEIKVP